jgi:serine O-acetyltransferase
MGAWEDFAGDRKRYPTYAWWSSATIYAVAWFRFGQFIENSTGGLARKILRQVHNFVFMFIWGLSGVGLSRGAKIGPGLFVVHGGNVNIGPGVRIGRNVSMLHGVTIGMTRTGDDDPTLGDDVEIGANATILGPITVGDGARIGAMSLVLKDVPPGALVVAPSARVIRDFGAPPPADPAPEAHAAKAQNDASSPDASPVYTPPKT